MDLNRHNIRIAGSLILISMIAGILSVAPAIDSTEYLKIASANNNQIILSAVFQFLMAITYMVFAIILYPIVKKYNKSLTIGFISFRILAAILIIIGTVLLLSILAISHEYVKILPKDTIYFELIGSLLKNARDLINHVFMILVLCISNTIFYILLFKSQLIPRWISLWGLLAVVISIIASILVLFGVLDIITTKYVLLNAPTALVEIILAIFLIIWGFNKMHIQSNTI